MVWNIFIDESGSLGQQDRYFIMAAIVVRDKQILDPVKRILPKYKDETKFYKALPEERRNILETLAGVDSNILYIAVDKNERAFVHMDNKQIYHVALEKLVGNSMKFICGRDVVVTLDSTNIISIDKFREICNRCADDSHCNFLNCFKTASNLSVYVQMADMVAGAIRARYENGDSSYYEIINQKVRSP